MLSLRAPAAAAAIGLAGLLAAGTASAYCRTSTTSSPSMDGHVCTPPQSDDSGLPIAWARPCITYSLQQDASPGIPLETFRSIVRTAFDTWMNADCGGQPPRIDVSEGPDVACAQQEYNHDDPETEDVDEERANANILFFIEKDWPYESSQLALTIVTFGVSSGEIYDADTAINAAGYSFTIDDPTSESDLSSVLTHEAGHFLGLAHSAVGDATMRANAAAPSVIDLRSLDADDVAGICAIYPPGAIPDDCDPTPRHGFSPLCAEDQGGCACRAAPSRGGPWYAGLCLAAITAALARRRSRPRPTSRLLARPGRCSARSPCAPARRRAR